MAADKIALLLSVIYVSLGIATLRDLDRVSYEERVRSHNYSTRGMMLFIHLWFIMMFIITTVMVMRSNIPEVFKYIVYLVYILEGLEIYIGYLMRELPWEELKDRKLVKGGSRWIARGIIGIFGSYTVIYIVELLLK